MFTLRGEYNGEPAEMVYNPYVGTLTWADGSFAKPLWDLNRPDVVVRHEGMYGDLATESVSFSPENPKKKSAKVELLKIQLGLKCNYGCEYCGQATHLQKGEGFDTNISDANDFLERLDSWLVGQPSRIEFWGGEPLVYIKKLYVLVPELRKRFPKTDFVIITNGSLLNNEIADFFITNRIGVTMSHDAIGQSIRGDDPLDDPEVFAAIQKLIASDNHFGFNVVLTRGNHSPIAIREWFDNRMGVPCIVNYEGVVAAHDTEFQPAALFTPSDHISLQTEILRAIFEGTDRDVAAFWSRMTSFASALEEGKPVMQVGQKCGMDREEVLATDLLGNAMTCQNVGANSKHSLGSVYDMENVKLNTSWHWSERESCMHCPVVQICQGSCMYLTGSEFDETCHNEYNYAIPIMAAVLLKWYGFKLFDIVGDIRRPKPRQKTITIKALV